MIFLDRIRHLILGFEHFLRRYLGLMVDFLGDGGSLGDLFLRLLMGVFYFDLVWWVSAGLKFGAV